MSQSQIAGYITIIPAEALSQQRKLPFYLGTNTIGRAAKNRLCIKDETVSSSHAKLIVTAEKMVLVDTSTNGCFFDGKPEKRRFQKNVEVEVFDGMKLFFGEVACQINRNPVRFNEETVTLVKPAERKGGIQAMFGSDTEEEIHLEAIKDMEKLKENKEKDEVLNRNESDEFSLGFLDNLDKKEPIKPKKQKEKQKEKQSKKLKISKEDKKQGPKQTLPNVDEQKDKKNQKKESLQKQKQALNDSREQPHRSKGRKIQQRFIVKQSKQKVSEENPKKAKNSKEKQQKNKKQKEDRRKKEQQKQEKAKKEKEQLKNKEKQELEAKIRQQNQRKIRQEQENKKKQERQRGKSRPAQRAVSKELKRPSRQKESTVQQLHKSLRNDKKMKTNGDLDTKKRISRKRLPSNTQNMDSDLYPLRRSFMNKRILISGFVPSLTKKYFCIVDKIDDEFDYLVMKEYKRTFKALYAICKGIHILKYDWIRESEFLEKTLKPESYVFKEHEVIYNSIEKVNQGFRVFKGLQFYLGSEEYHLSVEDIEALIYAGGGQVIKKVGKLSPKQKEQKNKVAIVRNEEEKTHKIYEDDVRKVKKIGFDDVYTIEMVLDSCQKQEIDWSKNKVAHK